MNDFETQEKYNFIFNQIVENVDDFVGSMAYVLYKRNKIEYIEQYKKEHNGKEPELAELREWQKGECVKSKLDNYKKLAQQKTTEFVNSLQNDKEKQLNKLKSEITKKEKDNKERERQLNVKEKELQKRNSSCHVKSTPSMVAFFSGVAQSFVASLIFVILGYFFIIYLNKETDVIKVLNKNNTEQTSTVAQDSINAETDKENK